MLQSLLSLQLPPLPAEDVAQALLQQPLGRTRSLKVALQGQLVAKVVMGTRHPKKLWQSQRLEQGQKVLGNSTQRPSGAASDQPPRSRRPAQHGSTSCTPGKEDVLAAPSHEPRVASFCRGRHEKQARSSAAVLERNTADVNLRRAVAADAHVPVQTRAAHCKATTVGQPVTLTGVPCCGIDSATPIAEQQATIGCPNTCTKRQAKRKMARYSSKAQMSDACVDASTDIPSAALTVLELPNIATSTAPKGKRRDQG